MKFSHRPHWLLGGGRDNGENGCFERRGEPGPRLDYLGQVM